MIVGRVTGPMMESVSLPTKEVTNKVSELPMVNWWSWSEVIYAELEATHKDVEATPLVFRGNKLLLKPSYL